MAKVIGFKELLAKVHRQLHHVDTEIIQLPSPDNGEMAIFRAFLTLIDDAGNAKTFRGTGDASPESLKPDMVQHRIRIAETRAIVRALRLAAGVGEPAAEEMQDYDDRTVYHAPRPAAAAAGGEASRGRRKHEDDDEMIESQEACIRRLAAAKNVHVGDLTGYTYGKAAEVIKQLSAQPANP